ncbi:ABC transporter permease subunit [Actinacidiphila paucisporea]|uniref:ABC-2 family transporter protein n=1 Tax=Actinacidiphila paucisporea TaxID=310782 RepID=A0A1M7GWD2_9ACTN|nr:ABC transporter permease subunit [Actinacidiphila paucisporea]SHM20545.1 ABC-2 family transporter protein [Actinacidiphila paucisporea]
MTGTATATPYRSARHTGRDGFLRTLHGEWTKFRTVRGWVIGTVAAALVTVAVGLLGAAGSSIACSGPDGGSCDHTPRTGPGGEEVRDAMTLVHRSLTGDGGITVRITSLAGLYAPGGRAQVGAGPGTGMVAGLQPWTKAGVIVKDGTKEGSAYAAVALTGGHGVRMQYDYTHDLAGTPGAVSASSPRWLRLTRAGDTLTGYDSTDGTHWATIGTAHLAGLPATVQMGLFTTSPEYVVTSGSFSGSSYGGPSKATAAFDSVALRGRTGGAWTGDLVGGPDRGPGAGGSDLGYKESGGTYTLTGSGDVAPQVPGRGSPGKTVETTLVGAFAGLMVVAVIATMFVTAEYRRGLIRTTLTASPLRGRVLAAKAAVVGAVSFATGLAAAAVAVPLVEAVEKSKHFPMYPTPFATDVRIVVGTAALFAVTAVLALALGTVLRRSAGAVTTVVVAIVLPYILAVAAVLPAGPSRWLTRLTPAAAFAVQQSVHQYAQVSVDYTPADGYFPLSPWAGFSVFCGYAAAAVAAAAVLLRRRDA